MGHTDSKGYAILVEDNRTFFDIVLMDMNMSEMAALVLLEAIKRVGRKTECIMVTVVTEARVAVVYVKVACLKKGTDDYLENRFPRKILSFPYDGPWKKTAFRYSGIFWDIEKGKILPRLSNPTPFKRI